MTALSDWMIGLEGLLRCVAAGAFRRLPPIWPRLLRQHGRALVRDKRLSLAGRAWLPPCRDHRRTGSPRRPDPHGPDGVRADPDADTRREAGKARRARPRYRRPARRESRVVVARRAIGRGDRLLRDGHRIVVRGRAAQRRRVERLLVTRTADDVADEALPGLAPLFLKIDVRGAELRVLAGGEATLGRCKLVQLETAMPEYNAGAPLLPEVVRDMADRSFLAIEVSGFSRPRTELVQKHLLFARGESALRSDHFTF